MPDRTPVLYVAGTGRTGSTLVGNILGSSSSTVSIGETRHVWTRGMQFDWQCGCGDSFGECSFWSAVLDEAFGKPSSLDLDQIRASERELLRLRKSGLWIRWIVEPDGIYATHRTYFDAVDRLYRAVARVSGASVIVDSSKTPTYGALLSLLPSIDLRVLHLVRDPRATAYSWLNPKSSPDRGFGEEMDRLGVQKSAFLWRWWNGLADRLWMKRPDIPVLRIRYETFASNPGPTIQTIREQLVPEISAEPSHVDGTVAHIAPAHTISGNPVRMDHGPVLIKPDQRWRSGLGRGDEFTVRALAGPVMRRYGYDRG